MPENPKLPRQAILNYYSMLQHRWADLVLRNVAKGGLSGGLWEEERRNLSNEIRNLEKHYSWVHDAFWGDPANEVAD